MENQKIAIKDKVKLLDFDDFAIVHKPMDKLNNVEVFYKNEFISINAKRLKLQLKAEDLYPKDYDLNSLFISFEKRKLEILSHYSIIEDIKDSGKQLEIIFSPNAFETISGDKLFLLANQLFTKPAFKSLDNKITIKINKHDQWLNRLNEFIETLSKK